MTLVLGAIGAALIIIGVWLGFTLGERADELPFRWTDPPRFKRPPPRPR